MNSREKTTHRRVTDALRNRLTHALICATLVLACLSVTGAMWPTKPPVLVSSAQAQAIVTPAPVAPAVAVATPRKRRRVTQQRRRVTRKPAPMCNPCCVLATR